MEVVTLGALKGGGSALLPDPQHRGGHPSLVTLVLRLTEQPDGPGTIRVYIVDRVAVGIDVRLPRHRLQRVAREELLRLRVVVPPPHVQQPTL